MNKVECIGTGARSKVYKCKKKGKYYAVKVFLVSKKNSNLHSTPINIREIDILSKINHPYCSTFIGAFLQKDFKSNIPQIHEMFENSEITKYKNDGIYLLSELGEYNLHDLIYKYRLPYSHLKRMMYQILVGLNYLHQNKIMHCDIKPGNILCEYDENFSPNVKIIDCGFSCTYFKHDKKLLPISTNPYVPPEVQQNDYKYNFTSDVWSLGCTFYEMIARDDLFNSTNIENLESTLEEKLKTLEPQSYYRDHKSRKRSMKFNTNVISGMRNPGTFNQFKDLLRNMLKIDKSERYSINDCLNHSFFSGVDPKDKLQPGIIPSTVKVERDTLPNYNWNKEEISFCKKYVKILTKHMHIRAFFFGVDLYQRIRHESNITLLKTCIYIGFKYFLCYRSPTIQDLFEDTSKEEEDYMNTAELNIYKLFNFNIYKKTLYECLFDYNIPNRVNIAKQYVFSPVNTISNKDPMLIARKINESR